MGNALRLRNEMDMMPWKSAPARRGLGYEDAARAFIKQFGHDEEFTPDAFDEWAWAEGYLARIPKDARPGSDPWIAHVDRRRQLKKNLNKAGCHPRMPRELRFAIIIGRKGNRNWRAVSLEAAVGSIQPYAETVVRLAAIQKDFAHVLQGIEFADKPKWVLHILNEEYRARESEAKHLALKAEEAKGKSDRISALLVDSNLDEKDIAAIAAIFKKIPFGR